MANYKLFILGLAKFLINIYVTIKASVLSDVVAAKQYKNQSPLALLLE